MTEIGVSTFGVHWRLEAETDRPLASATFARLVDEALEPALEAALEAYADDLVAVRRVRVPPVVIRAPEDAHRWAGQVSAAVAGAVGGGSDDVVRYRSHAAAAVDVLTRVALGDDRRLWAWQALGLWHAPTIEGPAGADAVAAMLAAEISGVVASLEATGRLLPDVLGLLGADRLADLAELAWRAAGGREWRPMALPGAGSQPEVSAAVAAALGRPLGRHLQSLLASSPGDDGPSGLRWVLAALLIAQADPDSVAAGSGREQVAAAVGPRRVAQPGSGRTTHVDPADSSHDSVAPPGRTPVGDEAADPAARVAPPALSRWAGLLFCLHPLRPLLDARATPGPGDVAPAPELRERIRTSGLPGVLHATGRALAGRAGREPWLPTLPADTDPALLTLAGLAPDHDPPAGPEEAGLADELADLVVAALRHRLRDRLPAWEDDELLRLVLVRRGTVVSDPAWRRVELRLDEVSVDLRAAGLDLDPGWLPSLGCVVRFRYV